MLKTLPRSLNSPQLQRGLTNVKCSGTGTAKVISDEFVYRYHCLNQNATAHIRDGARDESGGSAIQPQIGRHLSLLVRRARGPLVGQDGILRPSGTRPFRRHNGANRRTGPRHKEAGCQPAAGCHPALLKSRRFHFHVAHPSRGLQFSHG